jgi:hypothetical protein
VISTVQAGVRVSAPVHDRTTPEAVEFVVLEMADWASMTTAPRVKATARKETITRKTARSAGRLPTRFRSFLLQDCTRVIVPRGMA